MDKVGRDSKDKTAKSTCMHSYLPGKGRRLREYASMQDFRAKKGGGMCGALETGEVDVWRRVT